MESKCRQCRQPIEDKIYCSDKCKQAWHDSNKVGKIAQIKCRNDGDWTYTIRASGRPMFKTGDEIVIQSRGNGS